MGGGSAAEVAERTGSAGVDVSIVRVRLGISARPKHARLGETPPSARNHLARCFPAFVPPPEVPPFAPQVV